MCRCRCAASMAFTRACVVCRSPRALSGSAARSDGRCSRSAHISCTVAGSVRERSSRLSSGNTEDSGQSCASRRNSSTRKARQRRIRSESSRPLGKKEGEEDACPAMESCCPTGSTSAAGLTSSESEQVDDAAAASTSIGSSIRARPGDVSTACVAESAPDEADRLRVCCHSCVGL